MNPIVDVAETLFIVGIMVWLWTTNKKIDSIGTDLKKFLLKEGIEHVRKELTEPVKELIEKEIEKKEAHTTLFRVLSDPEKILGDMEMSASADEMRRANRTTQPRETKGPHARVWRPKLRNQPPSTFREKNPPRN